MRKLFATQGARDAVLGGALLLCTLGLMLFPQEAMEGAREGLTLCYNVIIPSLFPFFVLSSLVVELGLAGYLGHALEGVMRPLFNVSGACGSAVALGFVGGYPVGAKTAINLYKNGMCTKTEGERLLAFCNNSGPAFILGVVGAGVFASSQVGILLYLVHTLASVLVGLLFRFYKRSEGHGKGGCPPQFQTKQVTTAFTESVKSSFLATLNICAFVVFFTVTIKLLFLSGILPQLATFLGWLLSPLGLTQATAEQFLTGVLEISSGVWSLSGDGALAGRLPLAAFMLGWAGLSVHCQVLSFVGDSGLSPHTYLVGKLLHGGFSALLSTLLVGLIPLDAPVTAYLAEQVDTLADLDFHTVLSISTVTAWVVFLFFVVVSVVAVGKGAGKGKTSVVE